ncbi:hypothetical protein FJU30_05750 [Affinibrenneria salicis]|uniref:Uncharacterized protein n=1 Tax=Affinibrenneria salicis TaxID=2590031 RepID=A0A5J5G4K9_9GAMM|nr:hypothetical protein [Affinibrenneria salicis]KAA9001794.1 hypothetical protein FJU30_05750 [Affinibrenneria salicis]
MNYLNRFTSCFSRLRTLALCGALLLPALELQAAARPTVATASGNAEAQVMKAVRKGGELQIDLRFETTADTFGGEIIYSHMTPAEQQAQFYVEAGGQRYPLLADAAGKMRTPEELRLNFSYDRKKNPRVGTWQGTFAAPPAGVNSVALKVAGLPAIPAIAIVDRQ